MMALCFQDDDFQFGLEVALGATYHQAADIGEVLATAARIDDGDSDSWVQAWTATAEAGVVRRRRGREPATARQRTGSLSTRGQPLRDRAVPDRTFQRARTRAFAVAPAAGLLGADRVPDAYPGERVWIAYENTALPAYFFAAPDAAPGEPRPLVIVNNGSDGATSQMWVHGGAAASERGYHWMTFDGPGQQATLVEQGIPFRHDWEAVLTPVLDAMLARPDVDPERVAVIGISQAGY
jgi:hypothetical protein